MDINLICSNKVSEKILKLIKNTDIVIEKDASIILVEQGYDMPKGKISIVFEAIDYLEAVEIILKEKKNSSLITGYALDRYTLMDVKDVLYLEVYGTELRCRTIDQMYNLKRTLSYYEQKYKSRGIVRINKSQLVNMLAVKEIVPWFNSRLVLVLENGRELEVSRHYTKVLKELLEL